MLLPKSTLFLMVLVSIITLKLSGAELPTVDDLRQEYSTNTTNQIASWDDVQLIATLLYEGSDIPSAKMFLFDNGVLVLQSKFYSPTLSEDSNRFYGYEINDTTITLYSIDNRQDVARWLEVEESHRSTGRDRVISVSASNKAVEYSYRNESFYFSGFLFFRMD